MSLRITYVRRGFLLARVRADIGIALENATREIAERVSQIARGLAPKKTGTYMRGIIKRQLGGKKWMIVATAPHSIFVELSTRPHIIRPVRAKTLRFETRGKTIFASYVRHPGTRGQHVMKRAAAYARQFAHAIAKAYVFKVMRR